MTVEISPGSWQDTTWRQARLRDYAAGRVSFIPYLLPEQALRIPVPDVLDILRSRWGAVIDLSLAPAHTDPSQPVTELPEELRSPVQAEQDGGWLRGTNMVGVNLRTVGGFWGLVPYTLTLPAIQDSIHLLPVWEPGVVGSLYGMCSWQINPEFLSPDLTAACPWLDTPERQLRAVVNLLHATGRTVGMDVIPHTDRFSEMALAYPEHFEWLQRKDLEILDHCSDLHLAVRQEVFTFLRACGSAVAGEALPGSVETFFAPEYLEGRRLSLLFGLPQDAKGRLRRRKLLIQRLHSLGYETVPATMAPPYRGLEVDPSPEALTVDVDGLTWRDYRITHPQPMSRVFNPLARYKLYESLEDNTHWALDFTRPRLATWEYVCEHYADVQRRYGFDFMRGDMSHVQMRPGGTPAQLDAYYDLLGAVKAHIQPQAPYFGYFAESFLAPRDQMGYGEEMDHLEASQAEVTLGDLQSCPVGSVEFLQRLRQYADLKDTRRCTPCLTVMTADKDDPRFDAFYLAGNELRLFLALFLPDFPSYMALGFETRDPHPAPAPNEHYTKLYVFQERSGPKATLGPYVWGQNRLLFENLTRLRLFAGQCLPHLRGRPTRWLLAPDACGVNPLLAWTQAGQPEYVFVANASLQSPRGAFGLPLPPGLSCTLVFSTSGPVPEPDQRLASNGFFHPLAGLMPAEGRVYRVHPHSEGVHDNS